MPEQGEGRRAQFAGDENTRRAVHGALFWSRSLDGDTGHQWLRKQVADIMKTAVAMQSAVEA